MNKVTVSVQEIALPSWSDSVSGFTLKVLDCIKRDNWELSVLLCGDKTIKELNMRYRNINEPTDILSFPLCSEINEGEETIFLPGDIVISLDTLRENAKAFNMSEDEELRRLLIHGILHLNGMDHETNNEEEPMLLFQEKILKTLNNERIISGGGIN